MSIISLLRGKSFPVFTVVAIAMAVLIAMMSLFIGGSVRAEDLPTPGPDANFEVTGVYVAQGGDFPEALLVVDFLWWHHTPYTQYSGWFNQTTSFKRVSPDVANYTTSEAGGGATITTDEYGNKVEDGVRMIYQGGEIQRTIPAGTYEAEFTAEDSDGHVVPKKTYTFVVP
ncbi:MAG: hypothetical protein G01um1014106_208 [Parcubacteria group bacterium Gr01-1014_106]|nr:MAG: hypothetical protein G01um1014106_208 [Parcubacteria group bacterium Gr01-1014_106]